MLSLFNEYYKCTNQALGYMSKPDKILVEWIALAGVSASSIKLEGSSKFEFLQGAFLPLSIRPNVGVAANVILPRSSKKWSIYNELSYASYAFNYKSSRQTQLSLIEYESSFAPTYLKLINQLEYKTLADKRLNIHLAGGISNARFITGKNNVVENIKSSPNGTSIKEGKLVDPIRNMERGLVASIKISRGPYGIRYSFNRTLGFSPFISLNSTIDWHILALNFNF
jgi:hypothetical protein